MLLGKCALQFVIEHKQWIWTLLIVNKTVFNLQDSLLICAVFVYFFLNFEWRWAFCWQSIPYLAFGVLSSLLSSKLLMLLSPMCSVLLFYFFFNLQCKSLCAALKLFLTWQLNFSPGLILVDCFAIWKINFNSFYFRFHFYGISLLYKWEMSAAILYLAVEV